MVLFIENPEQSVFDLDSEIKTFRNEHDKITPEFAKNILSKTNHRANIRFIIKQIGLLDEEERKEYLESINVTESGLSKVIRATYKLLNLSTFFTVGKDECRAWTFVTGMSAPECAGVIHTDFQRGFICADVYDYDAIKTHGSEQAVKENGKLRMEGKGYHPKDGDIMFFKFNV